jgi:hypothetical protein
VQVVSENALGLVDPADVTVSTLVYGDFSQIGEPEPFVDSNPVNIVAEVYHSFVPFLGQSFIPPRELYNRAMYRPRFGTLTSLN